MAKVFFSYSHRDEADRDELEIHLKPLKREGVIETWHDRRIDAGDEFDGVISEKLETADIILLLVSPYFLHSDYCVDVEMQRAMERHHEGSARVIPVILQPCDWKGSAFGKLLAMPKDGKPISKFPNRHDGFLEVVDAIRSAVARQTHRPAPVVAQLPVGRPGALSRTDTRSSNLAVRKSFSDHERDQYLDDAFEYIAKYFEGSLDELQRRNPQVTTRFRRVDRNRFAAHAYTEGRLASQCGIRLGGMFGRGISYSSDPDSTNSSNEHLSVTENGNSLGLQTLGTSGSRETHLAFEGAAEALWTVFIRPLQQ